MHRQHNLSGFNFDAFRFANVTSTSVKNDSLAKMSLFLIDQRFDFPSKMPLDRVKLARFLRGVTELYDNDNFYHNQLHGVCCILLHHKSSPS
jgi:hypothetical protein